MAFSLNSDCLDRVGATLAAIGGVVGVAASGSIGIAGAATMGMGLLATACSGSAVLRQ